MASAAPSASTGSTGSTAGILSRAGAGSAPIVAVDVGHHCICAGIMLAPKVDRKVDVINLGLPDTRPQNYSAVLIKKKRRSIGSLSNAKFKDAEFGEDANLCRDEGYLFKWFKMLLDSDADSLEQVVATADNNPDAKCKVSTLMRLLLEWVKTEVVEHLEATVGLDTVDVAGITWVITVPALWDPRAKVFMQRAAHAAKLIKSLNSPRLQLALEPECAAIATLLENPSLLESGAKVGNNIMIVDAGAGTIDIAVLQILRHRPLKVRQIQRSSGAQLGSTKVDDAFVAMMKALLGKSAYATYTAAPDEPPILDVWEDIKLRFNLRKARGAKVSLGGILRVTGLNLDEVRDRVAMYNTNKGLSGRDALLVQDYGSGSASLKMSAAAIRQLFDPVVPQVRALVAAEIELARTKKKAVVDLVCLAGGFAQSDVLQTGIKGLGDAPVQVPRDPARSIARGAAYIACDEDLVQERIATYTIGIGISRRRVDDTHPKEHTFTTDDGIEHDDDIFCCLVKRNDAVPTNHVVEQPMVVCQASATTMTCQLYQTCSVDPQHTYDAGVRSLGVSVTVKVGKKTDKKADKTAVFRLEVGGTKAVAALNATLTSHSCTKTMPAAEVFGT